MLTNASRISVRIEWLKYQIGRLHAVVEARVKKAGGGERMEVLVNEPYTTPY